MTSSPLFLRKYRMPVTRSDSGYRMPDSTVYARKRPLKLHASELELERRRRTERIVRRMRAEAMTVMMTFVTKVRMKVVGARRAIAEAYRPVLGCETR